MRTCDPSHLRPIYEYFDSLQLQSLSLILGHPLTEAARSQSFLPVKTGGAGLRSAVSTSPAAFLASISQTNNIVNSLLCPTVSRRNTDGAFPLLQTSTGNAAYTSFDLLPPEFSQHSLSVEIESFARKSLFNSSNPRDRARLNSLALPHAGAWLDVIPSSSLNLNIDSRSFSAALGYRLGLPLMPLSECRSANCNHQLDELGDHALHCRDDHGMKGGRHDRIRDKIFKEAQQASLNPTKEMPGLIPGSLSRPADVFIENWTNGRKVAFDVSVTSPTQEAVVFQAAQHAAAAINARKSSKIRAHFENCRAQGISFVPLVVETFGGWDADAIKHLKEMAHQAARRWGQDPALEIKYFFQRLSVSLQRGNAALLVDRDVPL